jgi:hypothetical protein
MFTQFRVTRSIPLLFTLCALVACDTEEFEPRDAEEAVVDEEDEQYRDAGSAELVAAAEEDADAPWDVETDVPGDTRSWGGCNDNDSVKFCFWFEPNFGGVPRVAPAGHFDIQFSRPIKSFFKKTGTYRVALYYSGGKCIVAGPAGDWVKLPTLPGNGIYYRARRLNPGEDC